MKWTNWLQKLVLDHIGWKLLSLVIATAIWSLVATEPELSTFATVPLGFRNQPDDIEIASDPVSSVSIELRGPSGALRGMGDGGVRAEAVLDMSNVAPGQRTFTIGNDNVNLPRGVRLVRAIPSQVSFTFERSASRNIPVEVRFSGEGAHGYQVASHQAIPSELRITGPASRVAAVKAAVTDPVDVSGVVASSEFRVNAFVDDPFVRLESPPLVVVRVTMRKQ
jgi:YbbR domain-containing protein